MRPSFFPRETHVFHAFELSAWRTLSLSALEMGALTGVVLRGFRAFVLSHSGGTGVAYIAATLTVGAIVLFGMLTLHLSNFPVRRWPRHVAAFAVVETLAEMLVSAILIAAHREPIGTTSRATWGDLPSMALGTLEVRVVALALFALALAGIVQLVRRLLPRHTPQHTGQHPVHPTPRS